MTREEEEALLTLEVGEEKELVRLEEGLYDGVCIGVTVKEVPKYKEPDKLVKKWIYVFQVHKADTGVNYYFKSDMFAPSPYSDSKMVKFIIDWTKCTYEQMKGRFAASKMIGFPARLLIKNKLAKNGKEYGEIDSIMPVAKGTKVPVVPDEIPAFLGRNCLVQRWAEGITVAPEPVPQTTQVPQVTAIPNVPGQINDQQPDFGMSNPAPIKQTDIPHVPSNAKVTQAPDAKGWITQPAPQPAGAVPDVGTTAPEEDDDDSDLPF